MNTISPYPITNRKEFRAAVVILRDISCDGDQDSMSTEEVRVLHTLKGESFYPRTPHYHWLSAKRANHYFHGLAGLESAKHGERINIEDSQIHCDIPF